MKERCELSTIRYIICGYISFLHCWWWCFFSEVLGSEHHSFHPFQVWWIRRPHRETLTLVKRFTPLDVGADDAGMSESVCTNGSRWGIRTRSPRPPRRSRWQEHAAASVSAGCSTFIHLKKLQQKIRSCSIFPFFFSFHHSLSLKDFKPTQD